VQRFFSTFPNEWPGAGLLLLRLTLAGALFADAAAEYGGAAPTQVIAAAVQILTGALIAIGLWTPFAGAMACALQLSLVLIVGATAEPYLLQASVGLGLALLGPGAWSFDARLFGRRRVDIKHLRDDQR
jgi:uncharacterized membrane protein YphA (DoxX/SURF4 family)